MATDSAATPKNPPGAEFLGKIVTLRITEEDITRDIHVHHDVLCATSEFFASCFRPGWREAKDGAIELPDDKISDVETYVKWLYLRSTRGLEELIGGVQGLSVSASEIASRTSHKLKNGEDSTEDWRTLISAYIFGDKIQDILYKDTVIDVLIRKTGTDGWYPTDLTTQLWQGTSEDDVIRKLWIDWFCYAGNLGWFTDVDKALYPPDFCWELAKWSVYYLRTGTLKERPWKTNSCKYHNHGVKPCHRDGSVPK